MALHPWSEVKKENEYRITVVAVLYGSRHAAPWVRKGRRKTKRWRR